MVHERMLRTVLLALAVASLAAAPQPPPKQQQIAHDIYKELVDIDTTAEHGDTAKAAHAMEAHLVAAGIPKADIHVFEPAPHRGNLIARYRGTGKKKPMILMAHLDVVEAKRSDWSTDPFQLVEKDGWFYGRGTGDDKFMAAVWVATLVRFAQEHYKPDRDLILILETDEEAADAAENGIRWIIKNHRDLIDAEFALNEGGGVGFKDDKPLWNSIQTTEKLYQTFTLETHNRGGHSSQPRKDNAIYELAAALGKVEKLEFPVELNDTTRIYFTKMAQLEHGQVAADMKSLVSPHPDPAAIARLTALPPYNAELRTTCVATRLEGGHAENALPQLARATVNCRILPGHPADEVQRALEQAIGDPQVVVAPVGHDVTSQPSVLRPDLVAAAEQLTKKFWPGAPVVPQMSAGATDGRFLRNAGIPCYGHSGMRVDLFDIRFHGKDERVAVKAFYDGQEYLYELVKILAGGK
jgi:acetylornithine deacetylase/succinyl-diaminopimelate desuccinylase-like protein